MTTNTQIDSITGLLKYIVREMVDDPDQVKISTIEGTQSFVIEVSVAKSDMGKLIGKRGHNINAIRTILTAASATANIRTMLELVE